MKSLPETAAILMVSVWVTATAYAGPKTAATEVIPFSSLSETNRALVRSVTDHYTVRRPYAERAFVGQKSRLEWMLDHLQPTWVLARQLGVSVRNAQVDAHGRLCTSDGDRSKGFLLPVYGADGKRIYYMEGAQRTFAFTIRGRGVIVLQYQATATNKLAVSGIQFVKVENTLFAMLTQLCGPFLPGLMDRTYNEFLQPVNTLNEVAENAPDKIREAARKLPAKERAALEPLLQLLPPSARQGSTGKADDLVLQVTAF